MTTNQITATEGPKVPVGFTERVVADPTYGAYWLLRVGFIVLPMWMGLDKFFNGLTDWTVYLAPWIGDVLPFSDQTAMILVGIVEIVAGVAVAIKARYAAYVVALWLAGIIVNLVTLPGFYDVALRDFGLMIAAIVLGLLARTYDPPFGQTTGADDTVSR